MKTETPKDVNVTPKKAFLPEFYIEAKEPYFEGKGNHSVSKLEEICEGYKEYAHQADIAFYACSRQLSALQQENEKLREIAEWVAERFGKEYPGSTVGIMGRKAAEIISNQR